MIKSETVDQQADQTKQQHDSGKVQNHCLYLQTNETGTVLHFSWLRENRFNNLELNEILEQATLNVTEKNGRETEDETKK